MTYRVKCLVNKKIEDELSEYLIALGASSTSGEELVDLLSGTTKKVCAYFSDDDFSQDIIDMLNDFFKAKNMTEYKLSFKPYEDNVDWMSEWKKHYKPLYIGKSLLILPSWEEYAGEDKTLIKIDPEMAFGTGDHPTTKMCLVALEEEISKVDNRDHLKVLDFGCGSGILAICAKKLGAGYVVGIENDLVALKNAKKNSYLNGVDIILDKNLATEKFDILVANILPLTHIELKKVYKDNLREGCPLILSGILAGKEDGVIETFTEIGFKLSKTMQEKEWICMVFYSN